MKTIKWIIMVVVAVGIGTFVSLNILGKIDMNVWMTRGIGCLVTVISELIIYHYFQGKRTEWKTIKGRKIMKTITEIVTMKIADGIAKEEFIHIFNELENKFHSMQLGFVDSELSHNEKPMS